MALDIGRPQLGAALTDLLALRGRVAPALDPFVVPTISVADLSLALPPAQVRLATGRITDTPATAGERPCFRFTVPEGTLAVIYELVCIPDNDSDLVVKMGAEIAGMVDGGNVGWLDGRLDATAQVPAGKLASATNAGAVPANAPFLLKTLASGTVYNPPTPWIVGGGPGSTGSIEFAYALNNQIARLGLSWIEFQLL